MDFLEYVKQTFGERPTKKILYEVQLEIDILKHKLSEAEKEFDKLREWELKKEGAEKVWKSLKK